MEFFGKSFTEAVELLTGEKGAAPPPDRPSPASFSDFRLPPRSTDNRTARNYLTAARRIDEDVTGFFFASGDIYEDATHHNAVFVGRDESGIPRYAHQRGTAGSFRLDVKGSDKAFNFCYRGEGERLFVFEAPIDLLSFLCLFKKDWQKQSYLALGGVGEKALLRFLSDRPNIKTVYLCQMCIRDRLARSAGATEALKATDPMKWVGLMNACRAQAEEIAKFELIYV